MNVLWGLMGLYILNISIDAADPTSNYLPEDLSYNDQESIIEIVVEQLLGFENAIREYDDHDKEEHRDGSSQQLELTIQSCYLKRLQSNQLFISNRLFPPFKFVLTTRFTRLSSPPPQV